MSDAEADTDRRLAELRESFDRGFALPPADASRAGDAFLIVRAGDGAVRDLAGRASWAWRVDRKIVPLPLQVPGLLGLAGLRGQLTPVFSLASLLGGGTRGGGRRRGWPSARGRRRRPRLRRI